MRERIAHIKEDAVVFGDGFPFGRNKPDAKNTLSGLRRTSGRPTDMQQAAVLMSFVGRKVDCGRLCLCVFGLTHFTIWPVIHNVLMSGPGTVRNVSIMCQRRDDSGRRKQNSRPGQLCATAGIVFVFFLCATVGSLGGHSTAAWT